MHNMPQGSILGPLSFTAIINDRMTKFIVLRFRVYPRSTLPWRIPLSESFDCFGFLVRANNRYRLQFRRRPDPRKKGHSLRYQKNANVEV